MSKNGADRNLLYGIIALQMDFISRDALIAGMNAWVLEKTRPLAEVLLDQGAIVANRHELLTALVREHLKQHDDDPAKSLAAVGSVRSVKDELRNIADPDIESSVRQLGEDRVAAPLRETTRAYADTVQGSRFQVLRAHEEGGLGVVSVAMDKELNREVAFKEIQARHADNPEARARFVQEAEINGRLEHPGIVPVYGLGTYGDGRPFYAMRFIRGVSLRDAIKQFHKRRPRTQEKNGESSNPPSGSTAEFAREGNLRSVAFRQLIGRLIDVCHAIEYAHSRGILHRDLKPGNIMLGQYGETLVVDWGLAKAIDRPEPTAEVWEKSLRPEIGSQSTPTEMGSAVGTPQYMSPEQAAGRLDAVGFHSDVYSLGATLFAVLTGRAPFSKDEEGVGKLLRLVEQGEFPRPCEVNPAIPKPLQAICLKAMRREPDERYPSARALSDDLERWLADEPVSAWAEPWTVRARRWVKRHTPLVAGTTAALLVFVASAILFWNARQRRLSDMRERVERRMGLAEGQLQTGRSEQAVETLTTALGQSEQESSLSDLQRRVRERLDEAREQLALKNQRRIAAIRQDAERNLDRALVDARNGRLDPAINGLSQTVGLLKRESALSKLGADVQQQLERLNRFRSFQIRARIAQADGIHAIHASDRPDMVLQAAERALAVYGVLDDPGWRKSLAETPVSPPQIDEATETTAELLTLAAVRLTFSGRRGDEAREVNRRILFVLNRLERIREPTMGIWMIRMFTHRALGEDAKANAAGRQMTALGRQGVDSATDLYILACFATKLQNQPGRGLEIFSRVLSLTPNHYGALVDSFFAYSQLGDVDGQIAALTACLALKPTASDFYFFRGFAYFKKKNYALANLDFEGCIRCDPRNKNGHYWHGRVRLIADQWKEADESFSKALEIEKGFSNPYTWRAVARAHLDRYREAIADAETGIQLQNTGPDHWRAARAYAQCARAVLNDDAEPHRMSLSEEYGKRAVALLQVSLDKGYFKEQSLLSLQKSTELDPIRKREDFKKLLKTAEQQAQPRT